METSEETPSLEQLRELGSAEANAWTITLPGGKAMSLSEFAAYQEQRELEYLEALQSMKEEMESEARIRAARAEEVNAIIERENRPKVGEKY